MSDYLRSSCDIGCKTVWSEVLLCIKEDPCDSFYKEFCGCNIIYACAMSFMTLLESCNTKCCYFGANTLGFLQNLAIIRI